MCVCVCVRVRVCVCVTYKNFCDFAVFFHKILFWLRSHVSNIVNTRSRNLSLSFSRLFFFGYFASSSSFLSFIPCSLPSLLFSFLSLLLFFVISFNLQYFFESFVIHPSLFPLYIFHFFPPFIYYFRLTLSFLPALGVISLLRRCKPTARTKTRFAKRSSAHHLSPIYRQFIIQWHLLGGAWRSLYLCGQPAWSPVRGEDSRGVAAVKVTRDEEEAVRAGTK